MLRTFLLTCGLFLVLDLCARQPSRPYWRPAFDISALLPFGTHEVLLLKEQGIRRVMIVRDGTTFTSHALNEAGLAMRTEVGTIKREKRTVHVVTTYRYNATGQLVSKLQQDKYNEFFDTLAYDGAGKIIYYLSRTSEVKRGRTSKVLTTWQMALHSTGEAGNVLSTISEHDTALYTFDQRNELVRVQARYGMDSVSVGTDSAGNQVRRYWFREDSSGYHLGREETSRDGRMLSEVTWDMGWHDPPVHRTLYHYDGAGDLIRKDLGVGHLPKELFTYEDHLVMEHITMDHTTVRVERYRYLRWE